MVSCFGLFPITGCYGAFCCYAPCGFVSFVTGISGGASYTCCCPDAQGVRSGLINHSISLFFRVFGLIVLVVIHASVGNAISLPCTLLYLLFLVLIGQNIYIIRTASQTEKEFPAHHNGCGNRSGSGFHANGNANVNTGAPVLILPGANTGAVVGTGQPSAVRQPAFVVQPSTTQAGAGPSHTNPADTGTSAGSQGTVMAQDRGVAESSTQLTTSGDIERQL
mmetsp:Transcript_97119/g.277918  ORF Transcript_97119/g.277918 Transcript_97119/m.277918 type:complete len:222 (+) Transcript_97119:185-850(+)